MGLFIQDIGNSDLDKGMPMAGTRDNYLKSTMLGGTFISPAPPFIDFTQGGWNTIGNHQVIQLPNDTIVAFKLILYCPVNLTSGGAATISFGSTSNKTNLIPATTYSNLTANKIWFDANPASFKFGIQNAVLSGVTSEHLGFNISGAALTGGQLSYSFYYTILKGGNPMMGNGADF